MSTTRFTALCLLLALTGASCGGANYKRSYEPVAAQTVVEELIAQNTSVSAYRSESVMDYWVGSDRVKGTVLVMGKPGAFIRFNALNPTGGDVAVDLACDGSSYRFIDYNHNCQLAGVCSRDAIAQLLRVSLEPDDFLALATGGTPLAEHNAAAIKWDSSRGHDVLTLSSTAQKAVQTVRLAKKEGSWEVYSSELKIDGDTEWKLQNKDFSTHREEDGAPYRAPSKTRFEQPKAKTDLVVRWKKRERNLPLEDDKFSIEIPEGLKVCGQE